MSRPVSTTPSFTPLTVSLVSSFRPDDSASAKDDETKTTKNIDKIMTATLFLITNLLWLVIKLSVLRARPKINETIRNFPSQ
jgi:hypothetical protein